MPKLYELNTIARSDMNDHPELIDQRPNPVGITDSCVNQYEGTDLYQWWCQHRDAYWRPHGEPVLIKE